MSDQAERQKKLFGRLLRNRRKDLELEQEDMAERAGVSRQQWNRWETGASGTRLETMERIARALEFKPGTDEYSQLYAYAGFAPPSEDNPALVVFGGEVSGEPLDPDFSDEDPILLSIEAFYKGAPPELHPKMLGEVARIVREHQREQTTHGKKAETEE